MRFDVFVAIVFALKNGAAQMTGILKITRMHDHVTSESPFFSFHECDGTVWALDRPATEKHMVVWMSVLRVLYERMVICFVLDEFVMWSEFDYEVYIIAAQSLLLIYNRLNSL